MVATSLASSLIFGVLVSVASGTAHTVTYSDKPIWTVGIGVGFDDVTVNLGDTVEFGSYNDHDVVLVTEPSTGTAWDECTATGIPAAKLTRIWATSDFTPDSITKKHWTPPTCGTFYIACSLSAHCQYGQKLKLTVKNVDGTECASPCSKAACVTADSKVSKTEGVIHAVKPKPDAGYWGQGPYAALSVNVGDSVVFRTGGGFHDVATVPTSKAFADCDMSGMTQLANWEPQKTTGTAACNSSSVCCAGSTCGATGYYVTYTWKPTAAGDTYFVCSMGGGRHCKTGQKFKVTVKVAAAEKGSATSGASHSGRCMMQTFFAICFLAMSLVQGFVGDLH